MAGPREFAYDKLDMPEDDFVVAIENNIVDKMEHGHRGPKRDQLLHSYK